VGEEGARAKRGKVRGNAEGLTKRQLLPSNTTARARNLRHNASAPELSLWRALREAYPTLRFRRQVPLGPYFVDFCSHVAKLAIEVDGDTHAATADYDAKRTQFLNGEGYRVIRFTNAEVMQNMEGVIASLPSPLVGEGGAQRRMNGSEKS
jgi:very-short-patch-repair endonuclease